MTVVSEHKGNQRCLKLRSTSNVRDLEAMTFLDLEAMTFRDLEAMTFCNLEGMTFRDLEAMTFCQDFWCFGFRVNRTTERVTNFTQGVRWNWC